MFNNFSGNARTQSPTNKNYALDSPPFGAIAGFSRNRSAMDGPRPGDSAFKITEFPVLGKYDFHTEILPSLYRVTRVKMV